MNGTALRKPTARRVVGMVAGIVIIALGIALFKQSHLGNDSISALNMRLAELLGISLGTQNLCTNILFSCWNSGSGASTSALAPSSTASASGTSSRRSMTPFTPTSATRRRWRCSWRGSSRRCWSRRWALRSTRPPTSASRPTITFPSVCGTTHPARTSGAASSPDALSALLCWLLGGLVGLGTLICAFCLGPFIQFFDRTFSQKVLQYKPNN